MSTQVFAPYHVSVRGIFLAKHVNNDDIQQTP